MKFVTLSPIFSRGIGVLFCRTFFVNQRNRVSISVLDLFSGDYGRMSAALINLIEIPKNNLRIFLDGKVLHNEDTTNTILCREAMKSFFGSDVSVFPDIVCSMLTSEPDCAEIYWNQNTYNKHLIKSSKYCNKKAKDLPNKCILNQILNLQRDALTDADAADVFNDLIEKGVREDYIDDVIRGIESPDESLGDFINTQILKLRRYAASVTARDLSIIVTVVEENSKSLEKDGNWLQFKEKFFRYKLSIIDLDPKSLKRISKYVDNHQMYSSVVTKL